MTAVDTGETRITNTLVRALSVKARALTRANVNRVTFVDILTTDDTGETRVAIAVVGTHSVDTAGVVPTRPLLRTFIPVALAEGASKPLRTLASEPPGEVGARPPVPAEGRQALIDV